MRNPLILTFVTMLLLGCASTTQTPQKRTSTAPLSTLPLTALTPATPVAMPDLTPAQQTCDQLKAQFQTQLPYQILNQLQFKAAVSRNPLLANAPLSPVCHISMNSTGLILLNQGLTPNFMGATLERLDWASNGQTNLYAADSPIGHQEAFMNSNNTQLAIINYSFQPPAKACQTNQPIAACKYSQKKWLYQLNTWVF